MDFSNIRTITLKDKHGYFEKRPTQSLKEMEVERVRPTAKLLIEFHEQMIKANKIVRSKKELSQKIDRLFEIGIFGEGALKIIERNGFSEAALRYNKKRIKAAQKRESK